MSLWVTDSSSNDDSDEEVTQVLPPPPPKKKSAPPKKAQKKQVAPSHSYESPSRKSSNASVQKIDNRKQKNQENFNQKPAKVKKKRRAIEEDDLEIETNFTRSSDADRRKKKVVSPKELSSTTSASSIGKSDELRDLEAQRFTEYRSNHRELKCLLWFILIFIIITCGLVSWLFYLSLNLVTSIPPQ